MPHAPNLTSLRSPSSKMLYEVFRIHPLLLDTNQAKAGRNVI